MQVSRSEAELFAARMLGWLAEDNARISGFLAWSGESASSLRERLQDADFLRAVIEYVLHDEAQLVAACEALDYSPEYPQAAIMAMPGGEIWHWT